MADTTTEQAEPATENDPRYAQYTDQPTEEPTRLGDALPVVDGEIVRDAEPRILPGTGCGESTQVALAAMEGSPESEIDPALPIGSVAPGSDTEVKNSSS